MCFCDDHVFIRMFGIMLHMLMFFQNYVYVCVQCEPYICASG